jgi:DNA-binding transcriptional ArsR family regulator
LLRKNLELLGICHQSEWDLLTFIYRHGASLASADQLTRLVGYRKDVVEAALVALTSAGLIVRSRSSRGVRLYRFAAWDIDDSKRLCLEELMRAGEDRAGRLQLIDHLARNSAAKKMRGRSGLHLA